MILTVTCSPFETTRMRRGPGRNVPTRTQAHDQPTSDRVSFGCCPRLILSLVSVIRSCTSKRVVMGFCLVTPRYAVDGSLRLVAALAMPRVTGRVEMEGGIGMPADAALTCEIPSIVPGTSMIHSSGLTIIPWYPKTKQFIYGCCVWCACKYMYDNDQSLLECAQTDKCSSETAVLVLCLV